MKPDAVKDLAELPFCLRATDLARALNVSQSRAYEIMNTPRFSGGACRQNEDRDQTGIDGLVEGKSSYISSRAGGGSRRPLQKEEMIWPRKEPMGKEL